MNYRNAPDRALLAAIGAMVVGGIVDLATLEDPVIEQLMCLAMAESDETLRAAVCPEHEIRSLLCANCPGFVLGPAGTTARRWRVVHEATCPALQRYQQNLDGYTALPSGTVISAGEQPPEGTTRLVANRPGSPCGAVVAHRGPYASPEAQAAARAKAARAS